LISSALERCIITFPRQASSVVKPAPQNKVVLSHCLEVSIGKATRVTNVEVMDLPSAAELHLYFLVTIGHGGELLRKFWTPEILRIIITVILEMLGDFGL
jgi:hypothetical protein